MPFKFTQNIAFPWYALDFRFFFIPSSNALLSICRMKQLGIIKKSGWY